MRLPLATGFASALAFAPHVTLAQNAVQTAFDGARIGAEVAYSSRTLHVDSRHLQRSAVEQGQSRLSTAQASLAAGQTRLEAARSALATGQANLAAARNQLAALMQSNPGSAAAVTARNSAIAQLQSSIASGAATVARQSAAVSEASGTLDAAAARIAASQQRLDALNAAPAVTSSTMSGVAPRLSIGYGRSLDFGFGPVYIGIEGNVMPENSSTTIHLPGGNAPRIRNGISAGNAIRIGYVPVSWAMPYVELGGEATRWTITRGNKETTRWIGGARVGAGVEFAVYDNTLLRVGYDHTFVPDFSFSGARVSTSVNTVRAGLIRTFSF